MEKKLQTRLDFQRVRCKRGKTLIDTRKELLSTYQYLTRTELRRHHLPHYICVLKDLEDAKFTKSFEMLLELMIDNEDAEEKDTTGFIQKLTNSQYVLEIVKDTLIRAETAQCDGDLVLQCKILTSGAHKILDVGLGLVPESGVSHFSGKGWFWLVLKILEIALDIAETIKIDGGEREVVQRYLLARLLLNQFPEDKPLRAEELLKIARHKSLGMDHWKMDEDEGDNENTVNSCICWLMADMYNEVGRILVDTDTKQAMEIFIKAVKRANEANNFNKVAESLIKRGLCYMKMGEYDLALEDFLHVMCLQEKFDNTDGICEAHVTLSLVYQELKNIPEARKHLEDIIDLAQDKGLKQWQAMAYWRLGELLLKEGLFEESIKNFWIAYGLYGDTLKDIKDLPQRTRRSNESINTPPRRFTAAARKTIFMIGRRSSIKLNIYEMKDHILNKRDPVGFLYIPGPSKPVVNLQRSEYKSALMESLASMDMSGGSSNDTIYHNAPISRKSRRMTRFLRRSKTPEHYFLDDNGPDEMMNTYMNTENKEELNVIRCQYGVAKAHQYLKFFFEEVEKCHKSLRARHRIISWKLNGKPFWENRDQSEEDFLPHRSEVNVSEDFTIGDLSLHLPSGEKIDEDD